MPASFIPSATATAATAWFAPLEQLRVFTVTGQDAVSFLQGQLTNDIAASSPDHAILAGYCTAKGRLLATMAVWRGVGQPAEQVTGFMRASLSDAVIKRLRMFVLRAKAVFDTPELSVAGVWTHADQVDQLSQALGAALPTTAWARVERPGGTWICAPSTRSDQRQSILRWWWVASAEQRNAVAAALAPLMTLAPAADWDGLDMLAGLPWIDTPTQDLFIPQTVNLDLIEGVSFTKGCYPGQEVVARSHYRGTVKRRMALGLIRTSDLPEGEIRGLDVYDTTVTTEPSGRIIDMGSLAGPEGETAVLFEIPLKSLVTPSLALGTLEGPAIRVQTLPYAYGSD